MSAQPVRFVRVIASSRLSTAFAMTLLIAGAVAVAVKAFGITVSGGIALYFVVWWTLLFAVLPFGVRSQVEAGEVVAGSEPGAPSVAGLEEKAIWTTLLSDVVFLVAVGMLPLAGL